MLYLPKEEIQDIDDILRSTHLPCDSYWAKYDAARRSKIFSEKHSDHEQREIFNTISAFIGSFTKGNIKSFDPDVYAADLYALLCLENGLSQKGVVWFLQKIQRSHKQLPSIAEMNSNLIEWTLQYEEYKKSYEQFNTAKEHCITRFLEKYHQSPCSGELAGILNIEKLLEVFELFFPYAPFPGTYTGKGFNGEKADQVIKALAQPKRSNPFLMLCLGLLSLAQHKDIHLYHPEKILAEMKKLYPDTPTFLSNYDYFGTGEELFTFYTPAQWSKLDLSLIEKSADFEQVPEFQLYDDGLVFALLNPDMQDDEFIQYIRKVTQEYFEMEEMFK